MANYATTSDYAEYMYTTVDKVPIDCERLLARASELIEQAVGDNLKTTNVSVEISARQTLALKLATCAQVEYWLDAGENNATSRAIKSFSSGDTSVTFADGNSGKVNQMATRTRGYLNKECLLYMGIKSYTDYESGR